jgi:hypothetical protein
VLRVLVVVVTLGLCVYAFFDCLTVEDAEIHGLKRPAWVVVVLLFPLLGALCWLLVGRGRAGSGAAPRTATAPGWVPPDDNPEFLASLSRWRGDDGQGNGPEDTPPSRL